MKKIISIALIITTLLSFTIISLAEQNNETELQFDENGEFKICVLADVQEGYPCAEAWTTYMNEMLDDVKPNLVVFLGDNIYTDEIGKIEKDENGIYDCEIFDQLLEPVVERDIPFTFVFGNHDDEVFAKAIGVDHPKESTKEFQLKLYQQYKGCLAYDADPQLHGCATHNLPILSSDGSKVAFNLWMFDSGDYVYGDYKYFEEGAIFYDCVREDQIEWYKGVSEQLEEDNDGPVPSIAFQHIITQEAMESMFIKSPVDLGNLFTYNFNDGTHLTFFPKLSNLNGVIFERSCASFDNDGQWDAFVNHGDVIAVTSGHDHYNDFVTTVDGIDAIQIASCQYSGVYNLDVLRGAKIITINENDPWNYEAHTAYSFDYALKEGSELPGQSGKTKVTYIFAKAINEFLYRFIDFLKNTCIMLETLDLHQITTELSKFMMDVISGFINAQVQHN